MKIALSRFLRCAIAVLLCGVSSQGAWALTATFTEIPKDSNVDYIETTVHDFLVYDEEGRPTLNLNPAIADPDRKVIEMIKPGIDIDEKSVRLRIGKELALYPEQCKDNMLFEFIVAEIPDIQNYLPDVKDKRRITAIHIHQCLQEPPPECFYSIHETGAFTFDIGDLTLHLIRCRVAMERHIEAGKPFFNGEAE